jgi:hypothetical protein
MNTLVQRLSSELGIDPAQAESGIGAFLKLVEDHAPEQLAPVLDAVPGGAQWFERAAPPAPAAALNGAGEGLLGNVGDLLGGLLGGGSRPAPGAPAGGGGGLEDLLGGLLGGGGETSRDSAPQASGGGLGDLLGGILGGGGQPSAGGGVGGIGGAMGGGGAALLGLLATLLQNGLSMEKAAQFLPVLLRLLQEHAGSGVLAGILRSIPALGGVLGAPAAQRQPAEEGGGFDLGGLLGQVLGNR